MRIQLIWAQDKYGGIGKKGKLPWHVSDDLKNFKKITKNHTIIMGRLTWESLPFKPLPNRRNIVLSSKKFIDAESYTSTEKCIKNLHTDNIKTIFVIGGSSVYKEFFELASDLHITLINQQVDGIDCFFPKSLDHIKKHFKLFFQKKLNREANYMHFKKNG